MNDEIHAAVTGILSCFSLIVGWFGRRLIVQCDENTRGLAQHRTDDADKYATKIELKEAVDRFNDVMDTVADDVKTLIARRG